MGGVKKILFQQRTAILALMAAVCGFVGARATLDHEWEPGITLLSLALIAAVLTVAFVVEEARYGRHA